jgi:hypothetical protein
VVPVNPIVLEVLALLADALIALAVAAVLLRLRAAATVPDTAAACTVCAEMKAKAATRVGRHRGGPRPGTPEYDRAHNPTRPIRVTARTEAHR